MTSEIKRNKNEILLLLTDRWCNWEASYAIAVLWITVLSLLTKLLLWNLRMRYLTDFSREFPRPLRRWDESASVVRCGYVLCDHIATADK